MGESELVASLQVGGGGKELQGCVSLKNSCCGKDAENFLWLLRGCNTLHSCLDNYFLKLALPTGLPLLVEPSEDPFLPELQDSNIHTEETKVSTTKCKGKCSYFKL